MPRYRTTLRPPEFGGLPSGVTWRYVEYPPGAMHLSAETLKLPRSHYYYGVIETDRELTPEELKHFDIVEVADG